MRLAPHRLPEEGASTREPGKERSRSCRADPLAASAQFHWPSTFRNLTVYVQALVAADTHHERQPDVESSKPASITRLPVENRWSPQVPSFGNPAGGTRTWPA